MVAGREDVGEHRVVGFVCGAGRQFQRVEVGEGDAQVLGLAAFVGAHGDVAVGAAGEARVDGEAEAGLAGEAVLAETARDVERHDDAVAGFDRGDAGSGLLDDAHVLVTEDDARLGVGAAFVHMKVGPADAGGGDADEGVGGVVQVGVLDGFDADVVGTVIDDSTHGGGTPSVGRLPDVGPVVSAESRLPLPGDGMRVLSDFAMGVRGLRWGVTARRRPRVRRAQRSRASSASSARWVSSPSAW